MKRVLDPIIELDESRFNTLKTLDIPLLVLTRDRDDESSFNIMQSLADQELSDRFFVGVVADSSFTDATGTTPPFLTVFNGLDESTPTYQGLIERTAVLSFANKVSSPLIRRFDSSSLVSFMKVKAPKSDFNSVTNVLSLASL